MINYKKQWLLALCFFAAGIFANNAVASERDRPIMEPNNYGDRPIWCPDGDVIGAWASRYGFEFEGNPLFAPALKVLIGIEENDSQETFEKKVQIWNRKQAIERGRSQIQDWIEEGIREQQEKEEYFQKFDREENFDYWDEKALLDDQKSLSVEAEPYVPRGGYTRERRIRPRRRQNDRRVIFWQQNK